MDGLTYDIAIALKDGTEVRKTVLTFRVAGETILFQSGSNKHSYTEYYYPLTDVEWFKVDTKGEAAIRDRTTQVHSGFRD